MHRCVWHKTLFGERRRGARYGGGAGRRFSAIKLVGSERKEVRALLTLSSERNPNPNLPIVSIPVLREAPLIAEARIEKRVGLELLGEAGLEFPNVAAEGGGEGDRAGGAGEGGVGVAVELVQVA